MSTRSDTELLSSLNRHPLLKARLEVLLSVVEDAGDDLAKADAAERRVIDELRQLGNEVLSAWAEKRIDQVSRRPPQTGGQVLARSGEKNCTGTVRSATSTWSSRNIAV